MERVSAQCTISFTASQETWRYWKLLEKVAGAAEPGRAARLLLQERLEMFDAGWMLDDEAMSSRVALIVNAAKKNPGRVDDILRSIITESGENCVSPKNGRTARKKKHVV